MALEQPKLPGHQLLHTVAHTVEGAGISGIGYIRESDRTLAEPIIAAHSHLTETLGLNVASSVWRIISRTRKHNALSDEHIAVTTENVTAMLGALAADVDTLSTVLSPHEARRLAGKTDAAQLLQELQHYHEATGLSVTAIAEIRRRSIDIDPYRLQGIAARQEQLQLQTVPPLQVAAVNDAIRHFAADQARIDTFIETYNRFCEPAYNMAQAIVPQITRSEAVYIFMHAAHDPVDRVIEWAVTIRAALDAYPHHPYVTPRAIKDVMLHKGKQSGTDALAAYLRRIDQLKTAAEQLNEDFPPAFLATWAAIGSERHIIKMRRYIQLRQHLEDAVAYYGESISLAALTFITFKMTTPTKAADAAKKFVTTRRVLRDDTEGNPWVTAEIIDQAAAESTLQRARTRLGWLLYVETSKAASGAVDSLDRAIEDTTVTGGKASNVSDKISGQPLVRLQGGAFAERIAEALDDLSPMEADAVRVLFGLPAAYSERELAAKFSIPLPEFEYYVRGTILPKITAHLH